MTHEERMLHALNHEEPDRIPKGEVMIHDVLVGELMGVQLPKERENALLRWMTEPPSQEQFENHLRVRELLGFDFVHVCAREPLTIIGEDNQGYPIVRDVWGVEFIVTPQTTKGLAIPIPDVKALELYDFPKVEDFKFDHLRKWVGESDLFVVCQLDTGFFKIYQLLGFENYMNYIFEHQKELHQLMERFIQLEINLAKKAIAEGADCIWLADDYAHNGGPFISPAKLAELDFQYMEKLVKEVHKMNIPVVLHSCGNQNQVLDYLVDIGIDGLHSLQPSAHNDIGKIKKTYGDKLCLIGNIDINYLLPKGSPYQIDQVVKENIRVAGLGGGYVVSSCNLLNEDVPPENALAMALAVEKYGKYPLKL